MQRDYNVSIRVREALVDPVWLLPFPAVLERCWLMPWRHIATWVHFRNAMTLTLRKVCWPMAMPRLPTKRDLTCTHWHIPHHDTRGRRNGTHKAELLIVNFSLPFSSCSTLDPKWRAKRSRTWQSLFTHMWRHTAQLKSSFCCELPSRRRELIDTRCWNCKKFIRPPSTYTSDNLLWCITVFNWWSSAFQAQFSGQFPL